MSEPTEPFDMAGFEDMTVASAIAELRAARLTIAEQRKTIERVAMVAREFRALAKTGCYPNSTAGWQLEEDARAIEAALKGTP